VRRQLWRTQHSPISLHRACTHCCARQPHFASAPHTERPLPSCTQRAVGSLRRHTPARALAALVGARASPAARGHARREGRLDRLARRPRVRRARRPTATGRPVHIGGLPHLRRAPRPTRRPLGAGRHAAHRQTLVQCAVHAVLRSGELPAGHGPACSCCTGARRHTPTTPGTKTALARAAHLRPAVASAAGARSRQPSATLGCAGSQWAHSATLSRTPATTSAAPSRTPATTCVARRDAASARSSRSPPLRSLAPAGAPPPPPAGAPLIASSNLVCRARATRRLAWHDHQAAGCLPTLAAGCRAFSIWSGELWRYLCSTTSRWSGTLDRVGKRVGLAHRSVLDLRLVRAARAALQLVRRRLRALADVRGRRALTARRRRRGVAILRAAPLLLTAGCALTPLQPRAPHDSIPGLRRPPPGAPPASSPPPAPPARRPLGRLAQTSGGAACRPAGRSAGRCGCHHSYRKQDVMLQTLRLRVIRQPGSEEGKSKRERRARARAAHPQWPATGKHWQAAAFAQARQRAAGARRQRPNAVQCHQYSTCQLQTLASALL